MLTVAQVAGILAAKRTSELIPLCHPVHLNKVDVKCVLLQKGKYESSKGLLQNIIFFLFTKSCGSNHYPLLL